MEQERAFGGWAVAATAYRETDLEFQVRTRVFTIATHEQPDAERYAYGEIAKDFPPTEGWQIITSVYPVWILTSEV